MRKLRKLLKSPGIFFRDFLNKKYPIINSETKCVEVDEKVILEHSLIYEKNILNSEKNFPIDVVYTWVNKNATWELEFGNTKRNYRYVIGQHGLDDARFKDHNELFYSIKSVRNNIPWVRNIFVVTNNNENLPEFLQNSDIKVITHAEIIDGQYLPTFNSHVIEAHFHKIPELAEHFIYFNDDVFVGRELPREHFFQSNGLASLYIATKYLDQMYDKGVFTPSLLASMFSQTLIHKEFGCLVNQPLVHTYVPLKKSMYDFAWDLYLEEISSFLKCHFRGDKDINMATFLVPWLMYIHRHSAVCMDICYYFNIRSPHAIQQYRKLLEKPLSERPHSICANDFYTLDNQGLAFYEKEFYLFLQNYFI